jgi:hypothetical protein
MRQVPKKQEKERGGRVGNEAMKFLQGVDMNLCAIGMFIQHGKQQQHAACQGESTEVAVRQAGESCRDSANRL